MLTPPHNQRNAMCPSHNRASSRALPIPFTVAYNHSAIRMRGSAAAWPACRWLLLSLDRLPGPELLMTQELIANMLGVRREGVTEAAHKLQAAGLIRYSRGHITVLDRQGLETRSCECYAVVKKEYGRLLPDRQAR